MITSSYHIFCIRTCSNIASLLLLLMLMLFVVVVVVVVANDVKKVYSKYVPGVLEVYKGKQVPLLIGRLL